MDYGLMGGRPYTAGEVRAILEFFPGLRSLSSHRLSLDLPHEDSKIPLLAIAFVRNSAERISSWYFYSRDHPTLCGPGRGESMEQWVQRLCGSGRPEEALLINGQSRALIGAVEANPLDHIRRELAAGRLLLFPFERYDDACVYLQKTFPGLFPSTAYIRRKSSHRDLPLTDSLIQWCDHQLETDAALIETARSWFKSVFPEREAEPLLAKFRRECSDLERRYRQHKWQKRFRRVFGWKRQGNR